MYTRETAGIGGGGGWGGGLVKSKGEHAKRLVVQYIQVAHKKEQKQTDGHEKGAIPITLEERKNIFGKTLSHKRNKTVSKDMLSEGRLKCK